MASNPIRRSNAIDAIAFLSKAHELGFAVEMRSSHHGDIDNISGTLTLNANEFCSFGGHNEHMGGFTFWIRGFMADSGRGQYQFTGVAIDVAKMVGLSPNWAKEFSDNDPKIRAHRLAKAAAWIEQSKAAQEAFDKKCAEEYATRGAGEQRGDREPPLADVSTGEVPATEGSEPR